MFDNLHCNQINSKKAEKEYYSAREANSSNREEISKLFGSIDSNLNKIAARKNETFLNKIYHGKESNNNGTK